MKMRSQQIIGHTIRLEVGIQYRAHRPMADEKTTTFPVTIVDMDNSREVLTIDGLAYDQANSLINKFNNGTISFSGRVW